MRRFVFLLALSALAQSGPYVGIVPVGQGIGCMGVTPEPPGCFRYIMSMRATNTKTMAYQYMVTATRTDTGEKVSVGGMVPRSDFPNLGPYATNVLLDFGGQVDYPIPVPQIEELGVIGSDRER